MAKILLVKTGEYSKEFTTLSPPLGILYLAAVARRSGGHEVRLHDMNIESGGVTRAVEEACTYLPEVIGISSVTFDSALMHELARKVKKAIPGVAVIAGGPHPSSYVEETLANTAIDVSVLGEGEATFDELLPRLVSGDDFSDVRGIAFRQNGSIVRTASRPYIEDLDSLPFPAWDLLKHEAYWNQNSFGRLGPRRYMSLFTSRACPYGCIYCHKLFGRGFRTRSTENVLREMEVLGELYGITNFEFIDDCFNFDRERVEKICDGILSRGWKLTLSFGNGLRGDRLDRALLEKMKLAGTREIAVAIETASPRLQKLIGKHLDLKKVKQTIDDAMIVGIPCDGFFMLGFPTETEAEMRETVRFAIESRLLYAHFTIVTPFLGTVLASKYRELVDQHQTDLHSLNFYKGIQHNLSDVPNETVARIQREANRKFYLNPARLWRILKSTPQKKRIPVLFGKFIRNKIIGSSSETVSSN
jgi:radical SAM superfamily enzyme YgiQ (UPF0313 family)